MANILSVLLLLFCESSVSAAGGKSTVLLPLSIDSCPTNIFHLGKRQSKIG